MTANTHNTGDVIDSTRAQKLKSFIARVELLNEDKAAVLADIKEVFAEAKGEGFDAAVLREVVRRRSQDRDKRMERESLIDLYMSAIGEGEL